MPLWLKSFNTVDTGTGIKYTVAQINHYGMPIQGIGILSGWIFAWLSDSVWRGLRWPVIVIGAVWVMINTVALANLPLYKHLPAHWFLYCGSRSPFPSLSRIPPTCRPLFLSSTLIQHYLLYPLLVAALADTSMVQSASGGLMFSWASEIMATNAEQRAFVIGWMNNFACVFFLLLLLYLL